MKENGRHEKEISRIAILLTTEKNPIVDVVEKRIIFYHDIDPNHCVCGKEAYVLVLQGDCFGTIIENKQNGEVKMIDHTSPPKRYGVYCQDCFKELKLSCALKL